MDEKNAEMFMKHLEEYLAEEEKDSGKYETMAEMAPDKYKPILRDIAWEEKIHHKHLSSMLEEMKMCHPEAASK